MAGRMAVRWCYPTAITTIDAVRSERVVVRWHYLTAVTVESSGEGMRWCYSTAIVTGEGSDVKRHDQTGD